MNTEIRALLIERAIKGIPIYYGEIMDLLSLERGAGEDHRELSETLAEISRYETRYQRPMLSAVATYSPSSSQQKNDETHGSRFYELAEELGNGNRKQLKSDFFGMTEMARVQEFWKNKSNYNQYFHLEAPQERSNAPEFFQQEEILFLERWAGEVYEKNNPVHVKAKNRIIDGLYTKTVYWSNQIKHQLKTYDTYNWRMWNQRGWTDTPEGKVQVAKFKAYTWARIFKKGHDYKDIFFTVGVDAKHRALVYKMDYYFEKSSEMTPSQQALCAQLIPDEVRWLEIPFEEIPDYTWDKLIQKTVIFIREHDTLYDEIVQSVWNEEVKIDSLRNRLIHRECPEDGTEAIPKRNFNFEGVDIDWMAQYQEAQAIGTMGEELVISYEQHQLREANREDLAKEVHKVKDGKGYDILSKFPDGKDKHIEVKTTTKGPDTPFTISLQEVAYSEQFPGSYFLYHVHHLNMEKKLGEFHEYPGNIKDHFLLEGIEFKAYRKGKKIK